METNKLNSDKELKIVIAAALFTAVALILGYMAPGIGAAFIFTFGYLGGFILWLLMPMNATFWQMSIVYFTTLALFVVHKIEERERDFFSALSEISGVTVPEATSLPAVLLYTLSAAWLFIPFLIWKKYAFGYYLAWTFFAAMGITELAHFVFPFFRDKPYSYFPGMWSVIPLAPVAWCGMWKLVKKSG